MALFRLLLLLFLPFIAASLSCVPKKCGQTQYFAPFWIDDACGSDPHFRLNCSFDRLYFYGTHLQIVNIYENSSELFVQVQCSLSLKSMCGELRNLAGIYSIDHIVFNNHTSFCGSDLYSSPDSKYHVDANSTASDPGGRNTRLIIWGSLGGCIILLVGLGMCIFAFKWKSKSSNPEGEMGQRILLSYRELQKATNFFSEDALLGTGGYGCVYKATTKNGTFAIKRLHSRKKDSRKQFETEIQILSAATHPNLVKLFGWCLEGEEMLLIYEFVPNGTLFDHIHGETRRALPWDLRLRIAEETAKALVYLHHEFSPPIYHRDIKSSNILLDEAFHVKLGDFGISKLLPNIDLTHLTTPPQGTIGYLDPQYYDTFRLTNKSDVYSFGVVLLELITGMKVLDLSRNTNEVWLASFALAKGKSQMTEELLDVKLKSQDYNNDMKHQAEKMFEIALWCLAHDINDRPNMIQVLHRLNSIVESC